MIIRVDSIDNLTKDVADCIHTPISKMLSDIRSINFRMSDERGIDYLTSHEHEKLTEVYLCHLARRLKESNGNFLFPLDELLLTPNAFSDFLKDYDISFQKDFAGEMILFHREQKIDWKTNKNRGFNPSRFSKRLREDFCINGFQFLYDININTGPDYNSYIGAPEFIRDIDYLLNIGLVQEYREKSSGYVALCRLSSDEVTFDRPRQNCDFDTQYLYGALGFIWEYHNAKSINGNNPIIRAMDHSKVRVEQWIEEKDIPLQSKLH